MNYRVGSSFKAPFRIFTSVDEDFSSNLKVRKVVKTFSLTSLVGYHNFQDA